MRVEIRRCRLLRVSRVTSKRAPFNHSAISPHLESTVCERCDADYRIRPPGASWFLSITFRLNRLKRAEARVSMELCQTSQSLENTLTGDEGRARQVRSWARATQFDSRKGIRRLR